MIERCFMLLSTLVQLYHDDSKHIHVFPWFHQNYAWTLKCFAQEYTYEKPRGSHVARTQGPPEYKSFTLPLRHVGPLVQGIKQDCFGKGLNNVFPDCKLK